MADQGLPKALVIFSRLNQLSFKLTLTAFADWKSATLESVVFGEIHGRLVLVANLTTFLAGAPKAPHGAPLALALALAALALASAALAALAARDWSSDETAIGTLRSRIRYFIIPPP